MNILKAWLLAAAFALVTRPGAADPALAVSDVNMRSGPGTQYPVIVLIPGGSNVEVIGCGGGWCQVEWNRRQGFANQGFLDFGGDPPPGFGAPPVYRGPPAFIQNEEMPPVYRGPGYSYPPSYRPGPYDEDDDQPGLPPPGPYPRDYQRPPPRQAAPPRTLPPGAQPNQNAAPPPGAPPPGKSYGGPGAGLPQGQPPGGGTPPPPPRRAPPPPGQQPPPDAPPK